MKKYFLIIFITISTITFAENKPAYITFTSNKFLTPHCENSNFQDTILPQTKLTQLNQAYLATKITSKIIFYTGTITATTGLSLLSFNFHDNLPSIQKYKKINTYQDILYSGLGVVGGSLIFDFSSNIIRREHNFTILNTISDYNNDYLYLLSKNNIAPKEQLSITFNSNIYPAIKYKNKYYTYKTLVGYDKQLMTQFKKNPNSKKSAELLESQIKADIGMLSMLLCTTATSASLITSGNLLKQKTLSATGIALFTVAAISKITFEATKQNRANTVFNMLGEYSGGKIKIESIIK